MNKIDYDILQYLLGHTQTTQRDIATALRHSLGAINKAIQRLKYKNLIDDDNRVRPKVKKLQDYSKPRKAVILAAGFGLRMIPFNFDTPKGLLEVKGELLIERLIRQLKEKGIDKIHIVVGHLKESYEYLIDLHGVELIVNREYACKNNLHSLFLASEHLENTYILPCDLYFLENPFSAYEFYSWYALGDELEDPGKLRMNRFGELIQTKRDEKGQILLGLAYLHAKEAPSFNDRLQSLATDSRSDDVPWEGVLIEGNIPFKAKRFRQNSFHAFKTVADLQAFDGDSQLPDNRSLTLISEILDTSVHEITGIKPMKTGMTNRSFLFDHKGHTYVMRLPGEGSEELINRPQEYEVHQVLTREKLADELVYLDPKTGIKLAQFLPNARVCDPHNDGDLLRCMTLLRTFHEQRLQVDHPFDLFQNILFYEHLRGSVPSVYRDYEKTKASVMALFEFIKSFEREQVLCHIDAVHDNFLFYRENCDGPEQIKMIDWEYAGMQDPHVDIAMFSIYAGYKKDEIDHLIDLYFQNSCPPLIRLKIYAYVAICGLLWSNWCEYKRLLGVDFGEYSLNQYRYAKEYSRLVTEKGKK